MLCRQPPPPTDANQPTPTEDLMAAPNRLLTLLLMFLAIMGMGAWIYWPTFVASRLYWPVHSDDWHYWLIPLLSLTLLWVRRDTFPSSTQRGRLRASGILLIGVSPALLVIALLVRMPMLAGVSLVAWVAGVVWLVGGFQLLRWAWPSILLLAFVIPIPPLVAYKLSAPLQELSASVACYLL
ncbi:MAG: archaeosortase/exosortase family protein, partial [Planctomycetia bacterium]|nr:archaeosortase/exosortase family protein [Planctomycetia bacterium]